MEESSGKAYESTSSTKLHIERGQMRSSGRGRSSWF